MEPDDFRSACTEFIPSDLSDVPVTVGDVAPVGVSQTERASTFPAAVSARHIQCPLRVDQKRVSAKSMVMEARLIFEK